MSMAMGRTELRRRPRASSAAPALGPVQRREVYGHTVATEDRGHNHLARLCKRVHGLFNDGRVDLEERCTCLDELRPRVEDMALVGELTENMQDAGLGALGRAGGDAEMAGDLVRRLEPYAEDVDGEPVRVLLHDGDGAVLVLLVDLDGEGGRDAVGLEEDHHVLDLLLLHPRLGDPLAADRAYAFHLPEANAASAR